MEIVKVIWKILLLLLILTIPRLINWFLQGIIRTLLIIQKTLSYLIKLIEEELNKKIK